LEISRLVFSYHVEPCCSFCHLFDWEFFVDRAFLSVIFRKFSDHVLQRVTSIMFLLIRFIAAEATA